MTETSKTIALDFPFDHGGERVTEIALRRPKTRDLRKLNNGKGTPADRHLGMIADLAEKSPAFVDEIDPVDLRKINEWLKPIVDDEGESTASGA